MAARKAAEAPAPIIVRKITVVAAGHHGGAWKVAYADFVTAMMAFFLMLWLLGATTEDQRKGLADYFTPTLIKTRENSAGSAAGLLGGSSLTDVDNYPHAAGQTGTQTITIPRDAIGGPREGAGKIKRMRSALEARVQADRRLKRLVRQVRMVDTSAGVRIDLVDDADFSMFALGTTVLTKDAQILLRAIGDLLETESGDLTVRGHTDALSFRDRRSANNWSLSAGRAEATRQALMREAVAAGRFRRIEGVADREPLITADPTDPRNRRVSILVMN